MKNNKVLFSIIGIAVLVVALSGVTLAFFNYTRTGSSNNFNVGRIYFRTTQDGNINLTNVFPISSDDLGTDTLNHDSVTINIEGDTTYSDGVEYLITFDQVNNEINGKKIPISYTVTSEDLGEASSDYYNERGLDESVYKLTESGQVNTNGKYIVVGYIAPGETGIDGNITISAYLDKDKIAISDTYPESKKYIINSNMTQEELNRCVSIIENMFDIENDPLEEGETLEAYCNGNGRAKGITFQEMIDSKFFRENELEYLEEHNILLTYSNGTDDEWVGDRTVFTTSEWNSFQTNGVSFKVKAEANEGVWVEPEATPGRCFTISEPRKKYIVNTNMTQEELNACVSHFDSNYLLMEDGETLESFCNGTGTANGATFQQWLANNFYEDLTNLVSNNIVIENGYGVSIDDYDASCGTDVVIPSKIEIDISEYIFNENITQNEINTCVDFFEEEWDITNNILEDGETLEKFCTGEGTLDGATFQEALDDNWFIEDELEYLEENNIIIIQRKYAGVSLLRSDSFNSKGLTSVVIPNTVVRIEQGAFYKNKLTSLLIPNSVVFIGNWAFEDNEINSLVLGNSLYEIDDYAFAYNNISGNLIIPGSVKKIYDCAFGDNQITGVTFENGVLNIGNVAFSNNKITSVIIPDSVTTIGNSAFSDNQLTSVIIPDSVTAIGARAFFDNQLINVTIGNGINRIDLNAFPKNETSNPNLASITINKSCSSIRNICSYSYLSSICEHNYPWLSNSSPYTASGVTFYGSNNEVCDSW